MTSKLESKTPTVNIGPAEILDDVATNRMSGTFFKVEKLYDELAQQSPRLTKEFIEGLLKGEKGETWDEARFFHPDDYRKIPLYPSTCRHEEKDLAYVGCGTKTHHFYFGDLAYRYSIEKSEGTYIVQRVGGGFDPGDKFLITPSSVMVHAVTQNRSYGGFSYPGGPPSRDTLSDRTVAIEDLTSLEETLGEIVKYIRPTAPQQVE